MNKKTKFILLIGIIVLVGLGIFVARQKLMPISVEKEAVSPPEVTTPTEEITATPTEEEIVIPKIPGLSSCIMLDEEYCQKGEPLYFKRIPHKEDIGKFAGLCFKLPKGTKVYAPLNGIVGEGGMGPKEENSGAEFVSVISLPLENGLQFSFLNVKTAPGLISSERETIDVKFPFNESYPQFKVKQGELIGIVKGESINMADMYGEIGKQCTLIIPAMARGNFVTFFASRTREGVEWIIGDTLMNALSPYFPYIK